MLDTEEYDLYDFFGVMVEPTAVRFRFWAPQAVAVQVKGDFSNWTAIPLQPEGNGVFSCLCPEARPLDHYKFYAQSSDGNWYEKTDPFAHHFEKRPGNCARIADTGHFVWNDQEWMKKRALLQNEKRPINIYEVHLGSWKRAEDGSFLNYKELAHELIKTCKELFFTHVELLPITEHPLDGSWGYQVTGYFAPTSRFGSPDDFHYFVDALHKEDIGVILDWVPAHFPTDAHGLAEAIGTSFFTHSTLDFSTKWDTHLFDFEKLEVCNFLISSARFFIEKFHIDGLRFDAVSMMLYHHFQRPECTLNVEGIAFLKRCTLFLKERFPDVLLIAEETSSYPAVTQKEGLGFDLRWNVEWSRELLKFFHTSFEKREEKWPGLIDRLNTLSAEKQLLCFSHDDVKHPYKSLLSKCAGSKEQQFSQQLLLRAFQLCFPGKKLLFMGAELGVEEEWDCDLALDFSLLERKENSGLYQEMKRLAKFYRENSALWEEDSSEGFEFIFPGEKQQLAYLRKADGQTLLCVHNFNSEKAFDLDWLKAYKIKKIAYAQESGNLLNLRPFATAVFEVDL